MREAARGKQQNHVECVVKERTPRKLYGGGTAIVRGLSRALSRGRA